MPDKKNYIDVNLPKDWEPYLKELLQNIEVQNKLEIDHFSKTYSGLGCWIISEYLIKNTFFRFKHVNTRESHITIFDRQIHRYLDIYPKEPEQLWCEFDDSTDCLHVQYAFTIPEARDGLKKKGWKLPDV